MQESFGKLLNFVQSAETKAFFLLEYIQNNEKQALEEGIGSIFHDKSRFFIGGCHRYKYLMIETKKSFNFFQKFREKILFILLQSWGGCCIINMIILSIKETLP